MTWDPVCDLSCRYFIFTLEKCIFSVFGWNVLSVSITLEGLLCHWTLVFLFKFHILNWRIIAFQYCVSFSTTTVCISLWYTNVSFCVLNYSLLLVYFSRPFKNVSHLFSSLFPEGLIIFTISTSESFFGSLPIFSLIMFWDFTIFLCPQDIYLSSHFPTYCVNGHFFLTAGLSILILVSTPSE